VNGYNFLKENGSFKNPSSLKYNGHTLSKKQFTRECFTWVKYDVSAQNGFGGYVRSDFIVYFFDGQPIYIESENGAYFMWANNDAVPDKIIPLAKYNGIVVGECAIEIERKKKEEENRIRIEKINIQEDNNTKSKIDALLKANNINAAINEYNNLHYQDLTIKSKINILEDIKIENEIEILLKNNKFEDAIKNHTKLNSNDLKVKNKNKIQNSINQNYEKLIFPIENELLNSIISDNKINFSKLDDGKYNLTLDKDGKVNIIKEDTTIIIEVCKNKNYLQKNGFEYPATYKGEIILSTDLQKIAEGDSVRYVVSEKYKNKRIYKTKKGVYYFGKFSAPLSAKIILKPKFYADEVSGLNISYDQLCFYTKKANGIQVKSGKDYIEEKVITAKRGTGRKIFRIITSPIWGTFYILFLYPI
jgi:hypothetical protein